MDLSEKQEIVALVREAVEESITPLAREVDALKSNHRTLADEVGKHAAMLTTHAEMLTQQALAITTAQQLAHKAMATGDRESIGALRTETRTRLEAQDGVLASIQNETKEQTTLIRTIAATVIKQVTSPWVHRAVLTGLFLGSAIAGAYLGYQAHKHEPEIHVLPK